MKRKRLQHEIDAIAAQHPKRYLGRFWKWAEKRGGYDGNKRWRALAQWSETHRRYAWNKSHHARSVAEYMAAHHKPHHLVHRMFHHAAALGSRAKHFAKIEALYRQENKRLKHRFPKHHHQDPSGDIVYFDGKPHAGWIVRESLSPARASGVWKGISYSGYRTPEYSTSLCIAMCGRTTCPGQCAGATSNHTKLTKPGGAADVSDSTGLSSWEAGHGYPTRHTLPFDLPHHSLTGQ